MLVILDLPEGLVVEEALGRLEELGSDDHARNQARADSDSERNRDSGDLDSALRVRRAVKENSRGESEPLLRERSAEDGRHNSSKDPGHAVEIVNTRGVEKSNLVLQHLREPLKAPGGDYSSGAAHNQRGEGVHNQIGARADSHTSGQSRVQSVFHVEFAPALEGPKSGSRSGRRQSARGRCSQSRGDAGCPRPLRR